MLEINQFVFKKELGPNDICTVASTIDHIKNQKMHHKKNTFGEGNAKEILFEIFLVSNGM